MLINKLLITLSLVISPLFSGCYNSGKPHGEVLKIYNWADYIGDGVLEDSRAYYKGQTDENICIVYQTSDINEITPTKIERGHEDFDVVRPSEYTIERMLKKNLLLSIDIVFPHSPDYVNDVSPYTCEQINKLSQPGQTASRYTVCYMQGIARILYNKVFVPEADTENWNCLWDRKYTGKILMKNSYRDAYGIAIIYAHARELTDGKVTAEDLMDDYSPRTMEVVEKYLKTVKPNIAGQGVDLGKEMMTKNKAWSNVIWSGGAKWVIEEADAVGVELDYAVPREGSNVWYNEWVIPKYAGNSKAASYFINFMYRPDIALWNMEVSGYVSTVASPEVAEVKVDTTLTYYSDLSYPLGPGADSLQIDKIQYPDREVVERCTTVRDLDDKIEEVLEIQSRIKGDDFGVDITILVFVVVGLMSDWMICKRVQRYEHRKIQRRQNRRWRRQR